MPSVDRNPTMLSGWSKLNSVNQMRNAVPARNAAGP